MNPEQPTTTRPPARQPPPGETAPIYSAQTAAMEVAGPTTTKPRAGVSRNDTQFALLIGARIAATPQSFFEICRAPHTPGFATIHRGLREHPDFREFYIDARQAQTDSLLAEALEIVDDSPEDVPNRDAIKLRIAVQPGELIRYAPKKRPYLISTPRVGSDLRKAAVINDHLSPKPAASIQFPHFSMCHFPCAILYRPSGVDSATTKKTPSGLSKSRLTDRVDSAESKKTALSRINCLPWMCRNQQINTGAERQDARRQRARRVFAAATDKSSNRQINKFPSS